MSEFFNTEAVGKYWTERARLHGRSPSASWPEQPVIEADERTIVGHLNDSDHVLDIGCANGCPNVRWASKKRVQVRVDYIPDDRAGESARAGLPKSLRQPIECAVGDITKLDERDDSYNKLVVIRAVINTSYVGSRVLKPLLVLAFGSKRDVSDPTLEWNRWFAQLPPTGGYGTQKLFVFRKK